MANIPLRSLEVSFTVSNPFAVTADSQYTYIGGDATPLNPSPTNGVIRNATIRRGKQQQINKFEAGQFDAVLDNRDGRFDLANPSSPFAGLLIPMQPVRFRVWVNRMLYTQSLGNVVTNMYNDLVNCTLSSSNIGAPAGRLTIPAGTAFADIPGCVRMTS